MANDILKKVIRKFAISVFAVIYTFLALTQATFAWIVLNNEMQLENAELSVITGSSFYVSVDGKNFTTTLTNEMINKVLVSNSLNDITTNDGITFYKKGESKKKEVKGNYLSFPLWFRTKDKKVNDLFLVGDDLVTGKKDGTAIISPGVNWVSDAEFKYGDKSVKKGDSLFCKASDAMRIAIIEQDLEKEFKVEKKENLLSLIYDPSGNPELGFGIKTGAYEYYEIKNKETLKVPDVFPNTIYSLSNITNPYETNDSKSHCATFQEVKLEDGTKWQYTKVLVNIWLEGWDADCFDSIRKDSVSIQLKFMGSNLTSK